MESDDRRNTYSAADAGLGKRGQTPLSAELAEGKAAPSLIDELARRAAGSCVVLVHGFMQNGSTWDAVAHALTVRKVPVVLPTLHAASAQDATLSALACSVLDALPDGQQAVLAGYSLGGRVALEFARLFPERLSGLVLESAGLGPEDELDREQMAERNNQMAQRLECDGLETFVDWWETLPLFATQRQLPAPVRAAVRCNRLACDPAELALFLRYAGAHTMPLVDDARALLAALDIPVLYVAGTRDTKYSALAASLPSSVQVVLLDAGHNTHLEHGWV